MTNSPEQEQLNAKIKESIKINVIGILALIEPAHTKTFDAIKIINDSTELKGPQEVITYAYKGLGKLIEELTDLTETL